MGTSVSQPSPTKANEGGKSWKKITSELSEKGIEANLLPLVFQAYSSQYTNQASDILADKGAKVVEAIFHQEIASNDIGDFFIKARNKLAEESAVSLFSEFAINAAASTLNSNAQDKKKEFVTSYLNSIVEYVVSRDLTSNFGTAGNPNYTSLDKLVSNSKDKIAQDTPSHATLEATIKNLLGRLDE